MRGIARGVAFQARRSGAAEQAARHFRLLGGEHRNIFRNVREWLAGERLEEAHELAELVFGERERGHAHLQVRANAVAIRVFVVERRILQEAQQPFGIDALAFGKQLRRQLLLRVPVTVHAHEDGLLPGNELKAPQAVVFLNHPPAFLDVLAIVLRAVLIARRKRILLAAEKERGERANLLPGEMQVRHAQLFGGRLDFALVPDVGLSELVLEEALVVIPRLLRRPFRQTREVFRVGDGLFAAALGNFGEQREVQALDGLAAFGGQFGADAAFVFEAGNFMAAGTAKELNPLLAFRLEIRIIHEGSVGVIRRILLLLRDEVAGNVFRIRFGEAEARHHGHVLDLEFVTVIRALAVVEIANVGKALLLVILRADVFFLDRAVRTRALAGVVDPAHEVIVIGLFADAREVRRESAALHLVAFADGVAREATARFKQLFTVSCVSGLAMLDLIRQTRLPDISRDGF